MTFLWQFNSKPGWQDYISENLNGNTVLIKTGWIVIEHIFVQILDSIELRDFNYFPDLNSD